MVHGISKTPKKPRGTTCRPVCDRASSASCARKGPAICTTFPTCKRKARLDVSNRAIFLQGDPALSLFDFVEIRVLPLRSRACVSRCVCDDRRSFFLAVLAALADVLDGFLESAAFLRLAFFQKDTMSPFYAVRFQSLYAVNNDTPLDSELSASLYLEFSVYCAHADRSTVPWAT